jgi:hypothetical protein
MLRSVSTVSQATNETVFLSDEIVGWIQKSAKQRLIFKIGGMARGWLKTRQEVKPT